MSESIWRFRLEPRMDWHWIQWSVWFDLVFGNGLGSFLRRPLGLFLKQALVKPNLSNLTCQASNFKPWLSHLICPHSLVSQLCRSQSDAKGMREWCCECTGLEWGVSRCRVMDPPITLSWMGDWVRWHDMEWAAVTCSDMGVSFLPLPPGVPLLPPLCC